MLCTVFIPITRPKVTMPTAVNACEWQWKVSAPPETRI